MSDVAAWKARGPVRMVRKELAEWDPSHGVWQTPRGVTVATFLPDGQFSEGEFHNPDGSVARWARAYDEDGRLMEIQSWTNDGPRRRVLYSYDAAGRPTGAVDVSPDGTRREAEIYRYDTLGRKTKVTILAAQRAEMAISYEVEGTEQYYAAPGATTSAIAYDDRGLPAEVTFNAPNEALVLRVLFSRDPDGRLLTEVVHFGGETPFLTTDRVAPQERSKLASLLGKAFADQTLSSTTYAYDEKGHLLERTRRMGSLSEERTTFRYDDHDNPVVEISEDHDRRMDIGDTGVVLTKEEEGRSQHLRFDYQYDAHGNWTERVVWCRAGSQPDFQRSNVERAVPLTALYLWLFWQYLNGAGPPESTAAERRTSLRANRVSGHVWAWALLAGGLGIVALVLALRVANRLIVLPQQALPDLAQVPTVTVLSLLLMATPVAGIVEEAAFRGYMQGPIEQRYGLPIAILITGTMFAVAHLDFTLILWPYYVAVAAIYGTVTYLTKSILPAVVLHTVGNIYSNFDLWLHGQAEWQASSDPTALIWEAGTDASFWISSIALLIVAAAMVWVYFRLARVARTSPA